MTDTQLLDYLDSLTIPAGYGWQLRPSTTGRGWRLHTTTLTPNYPTARQAIQHSRTTYACGYEMRVHMGPRPGLIKMWAGPSSNLEDMIREVPDPEQLHDPVILRSVNNTSEIIYRWSDEACKWEPTDAL